MTSTPTATPSEALEALDYFLRHVSVGYEDHIRASVLRCALSATAGRDAIIEECAKLIEPKGPAPCGCLGPDAGYGGCDCGNVGDTQQEKAYWSSKGDAKRIRALKNAAPQEVERQAVDTRASVPAVAAPSGDKPQGEKFLNLATAVPPRVQGETPRTDAASGMVDGQYEPMEVVSADFARQLERELAEAQGRNSGVVLKWDDGWQKVGAISSPQKEGE